MWAGDKAPGLGALRGTERPGQRAPRLCRCLRAGGTCVGGGGRGRAAHGLLWLWWVRGIGSGAPWAGQAWAGSRERPKSSGGRRGAAAHLGSTTRTPSLSDPRAQAKDRGRGSLPPDPKGSALWAVRPGASQICTQSLSWAGLWLGGPCPGGGPGCDQTEGPSRTHDSPPSTRAPSGPQPLYNRMGVSVLRTPLPGRRS